MFFKKIFYKYLLELRLNSCEARWEALRAIFMEIA